MATLKDYRDERLRKLEELKKRGVNPYPARAARTHHLQDITSKFSELEGKKVSVVGRILSIRSFGKIAFIVIKDHTGKVQLFFGANYQNQQIPLTDISLLDTGDFVQADGEVV